MNRALVEWVCRVFGLVVEEIHSTAAHTEKCEQSETRDATNEGGFDTFRMGSCACARVCAHAIHTETESGRGEGEIALLTRGMGIYTSNSIETAM